MEYQAAKDVLYDLMKQINYYENITLTLQWDMRVNLPPKAAEYRGDTIGFLSEQVYKLKTDPRMKDAAEAVLAHGEVDQITEAMAKRAIKEYQKYTTIPKDLFTGFSALNLKAELVWQEARAKNDYQMFKDYMRQEFDYKRKFAEVMGQGDNVMTYLMDEWEEGMTEAKMDALFADLKAFLVPFLKKIQDKGIPGNRNDLAGHYPIEKQRELCKEMVAAVGYDFGAGRLDESAHPYTTANNRNDVRFTTRFFEKDFTNACISSMHELGHALYWQNTAPELMYTTLDGSASMGMDESQSRYLENIIGRSNAFWTWFTPMAQEKFPELKKYDANTMYRLVNAVRPSVSRLESDELTYNLHIIIRYELEKLIFAGQVDYDELPKLWNDKYEEYLGVRPETDAEGILQDMHWASGYIGYFQCYVLGNFYDGHYLNKMRRDIPDMFDRVAKGNFKDIIKWQTEHVHKYGRLYTPSQVLKNLSGEELSAKHYINYLNEKFSALYGL